MFSQLSGAFEEFKSVLQGALGFIREMHMIVCRHGVTENGFIGLCRNCRNAGRGEVLKDHIHYINHLLENTIDLSSSSIEDKLLPALRLKLVEKATGCMDGESELFKLFTVGTVNDVMFQCIKGP